MRCTLCKCMVLVSWPMMSKRLIIAEAAQQLKIIFANPEARYITCGHWLKTHMPYLSRIRIQTFSKGCLCAGLSSLPPVAKDETSSVEQGCKRVRAIVDALSERLANSSAARDSAAQLLIAPGPASQLLVAVAALHACSADVSGAIYCRLLLQLLLSTASIEPPGPMQHMCPSSIFPKTRAWRITA